jgi:hypothetical protein
MSKNNPANRTVADHLKQGVKNIPKTYKTLYTDQSGMGGGPKMNLKVAATGKTASGLGTKASPGTRAKIVAMGTASVTPLGPVAAFASGVAKSVKETSKAKAKAAAPAAAPKQIVVNRKPGAPMVGGKPPAAPATPATPGAKKGVVPASAPTGKVTIGGPATRGMPPLPKTPGAMPPLPKVPGPKS